MGLHWSDNDSRYAGRPLLRLLDAYVMSVIGHLDLETEAQVARVTMDTFGGGQDWKKTLRETVGLPKDLDNRILSAWSRQPRIMDPRAFTVAVSTQSFLPLIDQDFR
jgi:hypothetical protein